MYRRKIEIVSCNLTVALVAVVAVEEVVVVVVAHGPWPTFRVDI